MTTLALDLGTETGWATDAGGIISHGVERFENGRFSGGGMRYLAFRRWLAKQRELIAPDALVFEEVRQHKGTAAAHAYGGFLAHLTAFCEEQSIPYEGVPVGTIKRHVTGRGNAPKDAVVAAVKALGYSPVDHNEADAIALLLLSMERP